MVDAPALLRQERFCVDQVDVPFRAYVVAFALATLSGLQLANVTVTAFSVVCLLLVPGYLLMTHRGVDLVPLIFAALAWSTFTASFLVNDSSVLWPNAVAPAAFGLYLIGITVLTDRCVDLIVATLAGLAAGTVIFFAIEGFELTNTGSISDFWKYGIAHAVTVLVLFVAAARIARPWVAPIVLTGLGAISLVLNFRSHALICLIAAALLAVAIACDGRVRTLWQYLVVAVSAVAMLVAMPALARQGLLGPALREKIVQQDATQISIIQLGRTDSPMSITAILERPVLGWGSALNFTPDFYARAQHLALSFGFEPTFPFAQYWRLPVSNYSALHSIGLGSWAEGGALTVLLSMWLAIASVALVVSFRRFGRWGPIAIVMGLQGLWDLLFSPWTYNTIAEYACISLLFCAVQFRRMPTADV